MKSPSVLLVTLGVGLVIAAYLGVVHNLSAQERTPTNPSGPATIRVTPPAITPAPEARRDTVVSPPPAGTAVPRSALLKRGSIRERRENRKGLGLELGNFVRLARELKNEGEITEDTPDDERIAAVASRLVEQNPEKFNSFSPDDFQFILDLIERLWPMIERLAELFRGGN